MQNAQPYLSLVVAARNDDHGGNLLGRMQIFMHGWIAQARRYNLPSELIVVEWNPPPDRPRLRDALRWPEEFGPCQVRFIEVPREVHSRYAHADALPLYQMIAKNAGIRRARGQFVLATNIDILFSNELVAFLAERGLDANRMYRVDRYDAMGDVPMEADLDAQLEYCRTHLLRRNLRDGTVLLTSDGNAAVDKNEPSSKDARPNMFVDFWRKLQGVIDRMADDSPVVTIMLPVPTAVKRASIVYVEWGGFTGMLRNWLSGKGKVRTKASTVQKKADFLHTNACGDFTLADREHWFKLRGYPEFDLYSMNIDSIFCYAAHYGGAQEQMLEDPMRIYHIEHAAGSGWTRRGRRNCSTGSRPKA